MSRRALFLALFLAALALLLATSAKAQAPTYAPAYLATAAPAGTFPAGKPLCSVGFVESKHHERDGDEHVWLCGTADKRTMKVRRRECILGEIVPSHPLPAPRVGQRISMCGVWVEVDLAHGWPELHPVSGWAVVP